MKPYPKSIDGTSYLLCYSYTVYSKQTIANNELYPNQLHQCKHNPQMPNLYVEYKSFNPKITILIMTFLHHQSHQKRSLHHLLIFFLPLAFFLLPSFFLRPPPCLSAGTKSPAGPPVSVFRCCQLSFHCTTTVKTNKTPSNCPQISPPLAMFKRRTSSRSTNYTGVNHTALPGQEPSHNARAAALTIGLAISKSDGPGSSTNIGHPSSSDLGRLLSVSRLQLINGFHQHSAPSKPKSAAESRQSSLLKRSKLITTKPNQGGLFQNFELLGPASRRRSVSSLSLSTQTQPRADLINHRQVADLLLSAASLPTSTHPVKMVKKYVPTPNGIQVIEVPETVIQQEMARTNSMRGSSSRTSSLRRQDPQRRALLLRNSKPPTVARQPRLLLLVEAPVELDLVEKSLRKPKPKTASRSAMSTSSASQTLPIEEEVRRLDEEIERELQQVEELQKRRLQWEKLQKQRQLEEQKIRQLQATEENEYPVPQFQIQDTNDPVATEHSKIPEESEFSSVEPKLDEVVDLPNVSTNLSIILSNYSEDAPKPETTDGNVLDGIAAAPADVSFDQWVQEQNESTLDGTEKELLAHQLRPKFDNNTTTIPDELNLKIPKVSDDKQASSASLIQLTSTLDLPLRKPMKSAMKKPSKIILQPDQTSNPAHQAYLQLTTAENTRMNLKLLLTALEDVRHTYLEPQNLGAIQPPPVVQATTPVKRLSLRQSSPAQQQQAKSLRPQSMAAPENQKTAMSLRLLRNLYVAPIAPHPALQPGYKLPAKAKAADLYAKANSRPRSTFKSNPETKKILTLRQPSGASHSGQNHPQHITAQVADIRDHAHTQQNNSSPTRYVSDSRIVDSEDEEPKRRGFTSRFNDSDDEDVFDRRIVSSNSTVSSPPNPHIVSLREEKKPETQQKKKFGKLRKLFGK